MTALLLFVIPLAGFAAGKCAIPGDAVESPLETQADTGENIVYPAPEIQYPRSCNDSLTVYITGAADGKPLVRRGTAFFSRASGAYEYTQGALVYRGIDYARSELNLASPSGGIVIEGQRTNLLTYSQQLDVWGTRVRLTSITPNAATFLGLGGVAEAIAPNTETGAHKVTHNAGIQTELRLGVSVYAKYLNRQWMILEGTEGGVEFIGSFHDLVNCAAGSTVGGVVDSYAELWGGWCYVAHVQDHTGIGSIFHGVGTAISDGNTSYAGSGADEIYAVGAQVEKGFPSTYIATTSSEVTRAADNLYFEVEGILETEGSFEAAVSPNWDCSWLVDGDLHVVFSAADLLLAYEKTGGECRWRLSDGSTDITYNHDLIRGTAHKVRVSWGPLLQLQADDYPVQSAEGAELSFDGYAYIGSDEGANGWFGVVDEIKVFGKFRSLQ